MTLDASKVQAFTARMGIENTVVETYLEAAASVIEEYVGTATVQKWTTVPASVNFAAAKLIKMWTEQNDREEGISSETMSSSTRSFAEGESGLPKSVESLLRPLRRIEAVSLS